MRESLFNILCPGIQGARVLDLFAGTGALGIEALSRGAESALFIDNSKSALAVIRKNIHLCGLEDRATVIRWNILGNLNCLKVHGRTFSLVFLDPPYESGALQPALTHLRKSNALEAGARVVAEHSVREQFPESISEFDISSQRRYSDTMFSFCNYTPQPGKEAPLK
jgi:16S rRNA (guanine966-N2)-methyltransferase